MKRPRKRKWRVSPPLKEKSKSVSFTTDFTTKHHKVIKGCERLHIGKFGKDSTTWSFKNIWELTYFLSAHPHNEAPGLKKCCASTTFGVHPLRLTTISYINTKNCDAGRIWVRLQRKKSTYFLRTLSAWIFRKCPFLFAGCGIWHDKFHRKGSVHMIIEQIKEYF